MLKKLLSKVNSADIGIVMIVAFLAIGLYYFMKIAYGFHFPKGLLNAGIDFAP